MHFNLQGQAYHPKLESMEDLFEACALDEGLWVATSAPLEAFRMDPVFLNGLDIDQDKRIKAGELKAAVAWARDRFRSLHGFSTGSPELKPENLDDTHPDCQKVLPLLNRIRGDAPSVSLSKIRKARERLEASPVSEAGVVLPAAADSENVRSWMEKLLAAVPGTPHPSGKTGIDEATLARFLHDGKNVSTGLPNPATRIAPQSFLSGNTPPRLLRSTWSCATGLTAFSRFATGSQSIQSLSKPFGRLNPKPNTFPVRIPVSPP